MTKKPKAPKKQKISNSPPPFRLPSSLALPPLPNEVVVSILARISKSYYSSLCLVSKSFYSLLSSPEIYTARSEIRAEKIPRLYLYLRLPKPEKNRLFTLFDKVRRGLGLAPVRLSSSYAPARLNSTFVTVGFEIYQIGGGSKRSKAVSVLDCRSHTLRRAPRLTVARRNAKSCFLNGKIYVIGGREDKSMIWGEVFDIKTQIWKSLRSPEDDDSIDSNFQVVVLEGRVNVITKQHKYVYDTEQERWLRDVLFVDILKVINRPFCVIDDVIFADIDYDFKWFDSVNGKWLVIKNLDYEKDTIQLVNHGGKLVIISRYRYKIWCVVIRLEKRLIPLGTQFWGKIERRGYLGSFPKSYNLLSCLSSSL